LQRQPPRSWSTRGDEGGGGVARCMALCAPRWELRTARGGAKGAGAACYVQPGAEQRGQAVFVPPRLATHVPSGGWGPLPPAPSSKMSWLPCARAPAHMHAHVRTHTHVHARTPMHYPHMRRCCTTSLSGPCVPAPALPSLASPIRTTWMTACCPASPGGYACLLPHNKSASSATSRPVSMLSWMPIRASLPRFPHSPAHLQPTALCFDVRHELARLWRPHPSLNRIPAHWQRRACISCHLPWCKVCLTPCGSWACVVSHPPSHKALSPCLSWACTLFQPEAMLKASPIIDQHPLKPPPFSPQVSPNLAQHLDIPPRSPPPCFPCTSPSTGQHGGLFPAGQHVGHACWHTALLVHLCYTHAHMHRHARTCTHTCPHAYTHAHARARARSYTHTHTHTHASAVACAPVAMQPPGVRKARVLALQSGVVGANHGAAPGVGGLP